MANHSVDVELNSKGSLLVQEVAQKLGLDGPEEVLIKALQLFSWATTEAAQGRKIGSDSADEDPETVASIFEV